MPKYRNSNNLPVTIRNTTFMPGVEVTTDFYVDTTKYPSITETSSTPAWTPILASTTQSGAGVVTLADWKSTIVVRIIASGGNAVIRVNSAAPSIEIVPEHPFTINIKGRVKTIQVISGTAIVEEYGIESWT